MSAPTLRPYQLEAIEAVWTAKLAGQNRVLVKMPTGTGKTVMFAEMLPLYAKRWELLLPNAKQNRGARMLVIAHREELLDQAAAKIQAANPRLVVDVEQGDRYASRMSDVIIASIQTLAAVKFRRLKRLLAHHTFRLVIVDEAHHAAAASYRTALVHLGFLPPADATDHEELEAADFDDVAEMERALKGWDAIAPKDRLLVGVTATPNRSDAVGLGCVFQTIAYSYALKAAIDDGYLVPITPWVVESETSLDAVRTTAGDFNQKDLAAAVNQDVRNQLALAAWREHADGLSTIAFTVDVAHAHAMAETFEAAGVPARAISGETPREDRRWMLEAFRQRKIEVLCNCMVLTEGTDLPLTRCILHAKPTKSGTLYEQMTGRGLRLFEDKADCVVIDIVDIARRHSLQTAPALYGLPTGLLAKGDELDKLKAALEEFREANPNLDVDALLAAGRLTLEQLKAKATTFDIWKIPDLGEYRELVSLNWLRQAADRFKLSYPWQEGTEVLEVGPNLLGKFDVTATFREVISADAKYPYARRAAGASYQVQTRQRTLAADVVSAAEALKLAEAFVTQERRQVARLRDREAPWRVRPASQKQIDLLRKMRVPMPGGPLTAGQASDLIDVAMSRKR